MSEYKFILFFIIGVIFVIIHLCNAKLLNSPKPKEYDGFGTITRINMNDRGRPWYYVDIDINGQVYSAQTDTYQKVPDSVDKGDTVSVKYRFTKNGSVRCYITQEGFERIIRENHKEKPIALYAAIGCFFVFAFMLIKTLLFP